MKSTRVWRILAVLAAMSVASAAQQFPSTTLHEQTSNNTSASNSFHGMKNGNAAPGHVSKLPVRSLLYPGATTKIYARLMPWWGDEHHIDIGYDSRDRGQVQRQVNDMISRGLDGTIIDWYGPDNEHHNTTAQRIRDEAEKHSGFEFALTEDTGALKQCTKNPGCDQTQEVTRQLNYAYKEFERSPAYMKRDGRPVFFFFGLEKKPIDWGRVRAGVQGNPIFVHRNSGAFEYPGSEGGFAWIGFSNEPRNGMEYLNRFYRKYFEASGHKRVQVFGAAYKGFDDSAASWGKQKYLDQRCGQTWLDSFAEPSAFFSRNKQLDSLQIVTWNDYEEGTEVETGIDDCVQVQPQLDGTNLRWNVSGNENAVDHYSVYASPDGEKLFEIAQVSARDKKLKLDAVTLPRGTRELFVQAVGKPMVLDKMSGPVMLPGR
jgi:hypothetical protein